MKKSEIYGLVGSILMTGLLILLLFFIFLPSNIQPEEEGIMVSFGNAAMGNGSTPKPAMEQTKVVKTSTPPPAPAAKPIKEKLMTQDDNSLAIAEQKKKDRKEKEAKQALEKQRLESIRIANEKKQKEQEAIEKASAMNGLFGNNGDKGSGTSSGSGREGNPAGSGNSGGNSWSLNGRSLLGSLASPSYVNDVEGKITVTIRVNENGLVLSASIGSPTNISDATTRNAAINAARRTRFTAGNGVASGSITYNFKLR